MKKYIGILEEEIKYVPNVGEVYFQGLKHFEKEK
jgi:hypothetical protein